MIVALSGANGFIGQHLQWIWPATFRRIPRGGASPEILSGADAVVHLAGEPVAQRWNPAVKKRIRDSRVEGTRALTRAIGFTDKRPRVLVCASAVGYYGDRADELLDEQAAPGAGFLPEVSREWEEAADSASAHGVRVVKIRIGVVLGRDGGALKKMLPAFRLGLGGKLGSGNQWMSWIHVEDLCGMIRFAAEHEAVSGVWNGVAPNPVTNREFTKTLAEAVHRPAIFPVPAFAAGGWRDVADPAELAAVRAGGPVGGGL
jgi:uncharacterized protein